MAANPAVFIPDLKHFLPLLIPGAIRVVGAVFILVIGYWLSSKAEYIIDKLLSRSVRFDQMLRGFFSNLTRYFILTITGLTVLSQFGVQTTSLVAVIGAASLAIGLALQGTLSNLAAGVMLLIFRPFRIGHHIQVGGNDGNVKNLTLFWTEVVTDANVQIIIPNSGVWGQALKNFSIYPQPAATAQVRIPIADANALGNVREKVQAIIGAIPNVAIAPDPIVLFSRSPTDNSLQILVKFIANTGDPDAAASDIIEAVQNGLEQ